MLETLHRRNLFLVPLDSENRWFRYHHLFADLLRKRLHQSKKTDVANLHRRASQWFEDHGFVDEALHHALAAGDNRRAATLLVDPANEALRYGRVQWVEEQLQALPSTEVEQHPDLLMAWAWVCYFQQQPDRMVGFLDQVDRLAQTGSVDTARQNQLLGQANLLRAWAVRNQGSVDQSVDLLQRSLRLLPADDYNYRGLVYLVLGTLNDIQGQMEQALDALAQAAALSLKADNLAAYMGAQSNLADIERRLGRLRAAQDRLHQVLRWAELEHLHYLPSLADVQSALAGIFYVRNDLDQAAHFLDLARAQAERGLAATRLPIFLELGAARLHLASGDTEGARQSIQQVAVQSHKWPPSVARFNVAVDLARLNLQLGELAHAEQWQRESGIELDQPVERYTPETWTTLIRLFLARQRLKGTPLPVADLLRLLADLRQRHALLLGHQAEFHLLKALGHQAQGETDTALQSFQRALELAAPAGYVRLFLDEGEPVQRLLDVLSGQTDPIVQRHLTHLRQAFSIDETRAVVPVQPGADAAETPLLDPLTDREIETLRLLATDLSIPEIANELVVTVSTVRSYCKRIYAKLDAHSRIEAISRAQQMRLI